MYVTGESGDLLGIDPFTASELRAIAYRAGDGMSLWTRRYDDGGGYDSVFDIGTSPDGSVVFVTGVSAVAGDILRLRDRGVSSRLTNPSLGWQLHDSERGKPRAFVRPFVCAPRQDKARAHRSRSGSRFDP